MGRWSDNRTNNKAVTDAINEMDTNPDKALKKLADLADKAAKHDKQDAQVMRDIIENHRHLSG